MYLRTVTSFFLLLVFVVTPPCYYAQTVNARCLHKGCEMSPGLSKEDLNGTISSLLKENEYDYKDNILRIVTWNLKLNRYERFSRDWETRKTKLCSYINQMQPTILGLQEVQESHIASLKQCLPKYTIISGRPTNVNGVNLYNPIVYRNWRRLRVIKSNTFWVSLTPNVENSKLNSTLKPVSCTWVKMYFAERKSRYPRSYVPRAAKRESYRDMIMRLIRRFVIVTKKAGEELAESRQAARDSRPPKIAYRWTTFYVAVTKLDGVNEVSAEKQAHLLTKHLRNKIMDRRRFPIIVMGDLGFEDNTPVYDVFDKVHWLKNTMVTSRDKYPELSLVRSVASSKEGLIDYIWQNKFQSVMAATLTDTESDGRITDHRPVITALLPPV